MTVSAEINGIVTSVTHALTARRCSGADISSCLSQWSSNRRPAGTFSKTATKIAEALRDTTPLGRL